MRPRMTRTAANVFRRDVSMTLLSAGTVAEALLAKIGQQLDPVVEEDERRLTRAAFRDPKRGAVGFDDATGC